MARETRRVVPLFQNRRTDDTLFPEIVGIAHVILPLCGVKHAEARMRSGCLQTMILELVTSRSLPPEWLCGLRLELVDGGRLLAETAIALVQVGKHGPKGRWHVPARTLPIIQPVLKVGDGTEIILRSSSGQEWKWKLAPLLSSAA
ncbi:hypothetical protein A2856_01005 [Candidatus Uhrbacteria bacterium RIFCSPHIGHO2_01_FULL_63_20]|uniref:Uncharacterized protein n=1 Tax=Candidatus Uhrbacteria bacterium RIFCSPHIGHO2_01_FULL_63_20 TaxID=1802385 RepID=A0A1F7TN68_9BACT|nr:MAG: hypothetical protein A2856_01005 [Candidatus Uhrbacteria bacterium RIFCSPHIGHO2_01_FULL_63_20]